MGALLDHRPTYEITDDDADWILDPIKFISVFWPKVRIYDKQAEILYSLRDNDETIVRAGNQLGKDFITGLACLWFFCSRSPCHIITSSSSQTQLKSVLWGEMRNFIDSAAYPLGIEVNDSAVYQIRADGTREPKSYILGVVTNVVETLQGHHLDRNGKPRCLAVFDECSSIDDPFYFATETWAHRKLAIGNPLPCGNFFRRYSKQGSLLRPGTTKYFYRKIIKIKAEDSPNVQRGLYQVRQGKKPDDKTVVPGVIGYELYQKRRMLWNVQQQCVGLDAEFYDGAEVLLYPPARLNMAETNALKLAGVPRTPEAIGVDPAEGGDSTVWSIVDRLGLIKQISKKTPDTSVIPVETIALMREYGIAPERVIFDRGGGKQHADNLRKLGYEVATIGFGESVQDPNRFRRMQTSTEKAKASESRYAYKNRRAQMYHMTSLLFDENHVWEDQIVSADGTYPKQHVFAIPAEYTELRRQLGVMPLEYDEEGRIKLPPKKKPTPTFKGVTIEDMLGCSPDEADSFVLACYGMLTIKKQMVAGTSLM